VPSEPTNATPLNLFTATAAPEVRLPTYDRSAVTAGIAHFGVGNFFRVHEARYIDDCLHLPGQAQWGIVGIGVRESADAKAKAERYAAQDGLYTMTEYAPDGSASTRVIGAMIDYRYVPNDPAAVVELLASDPIRIVSMTLTEGGYFRNEANGAFDPNHPEIQQDVNNPMPRTVFGLLAAALRRRRTAGISPFTVVSCDNLRGNGRTARQSLVGFAQITDPEFAEWIQENVAFPDGMVDRIAPGVDAQTAQRVREQTGVADSMPAVAESFSQWVIQDRFPAGRPQLDKVGVELREDVSDFEAVKGRILNASHMLLCFPAILIGHRLVHEAMNDDNLQGLLRQFLERDVIPFIQAPPGVLLQSYVDSVLERFGNPAVGDQLLRIANDGASKVPTFHSRTIETLLREHADISREAFLLAAYRRSLCGIDDRGQSYQVSEPTLTSADLELLHSPEPADALAATPFAALHLADDAVFLARYRQMVDQIETAGTAETLQNLL